MSYAVSNDGKTYRAISGPDDLLPGEVLSDAPPSVVQAASGYAELRAVEYAKKTIGEQLDMMYWDAVNGTTLWRDWVAGIKARIPKP